jgi:ABC-type branched-chain amino acid transport system, permease component
MSTEREEANGKERFTDNDAVLIVANAIALLSLPLVLVNGFQIVGELIGISVGGYVGLPSLILIYGIVVIGYNLLLGYTGLLSFGHAAFFGTGAYVAGITSQTIGSPIVMLLVGTAAATLIAWPIGWVSIRRTGVYFAVITLTFGQMLYFWALGPGAWLTNGDDGFSSVETGALLGTFDLDAAVVSGVPLLDAYTWEYVMIALFTIGALWTANRVLNSPYGLIFEALGQNQQRVSFVGLDVTQYKLMAFIISAVFAGAGGALFIIHESYIHPSTAYYWIQSGDFVIMTVLGGAGSLVGPIFGAFIFEYVANVISGVSLPVIGAIGSLWRIVLGGVFVLIIWTFPKGIYPGIRDAVVWLSSRIGGGGGEDE